MKIAELRSKEIINADDGKRLGFLTDLDINLEDGKLEALVIKGASKLFGFMGGSKDLVIPWKMIQKIGHDTIIVSIPEKYFPF